MGCLVRKFVGERIYLPQTVAATFANQSFSTVVPINAHSYNKAKVIKLKKPYKEQGLDLTSSNVKSSKRARVTFYDKIRQL